MKNEDRKRRVAEFSTRVILFYSALLFTCVVGIIELLPEFENIRGVFGFLSISIIYFTLLIGAVLTMRWAFGQYGMVARKYAFRAAIFEPFATKGKIIRDFLTIGMCLVFVVLYLVKIKVLS